MPNKLFFSDSAEAGSSKDAEAHTCTVSSVPESDIFLLLKLFKAVGLI